MRKVLIAVITVWSVFYFSIIAFAQYTSNASPATVTLNLTTKQVSLTFAFTTRNLTVANNDPNDAIIVDVKNPNNTTDKASGFVIGANEELNLYDFATNGISIFLDNQYIGGNGVASPISVIATY